ncbi:MAG: MFS transporter [Candidatus Lokiarchaeota archaeon]|nr:MFS transporter [Candidatus Lokiarchaeota archaeon]
MVTPNSLRELKGKRLFGYALGNFGISMLNIFSGSFVFQFYVYTINLDPVLASVGLSFNVFISAFFSIIFGVIMDNKKPGKFGKRRPFLLYALPFWIISSIIIWFPPFAPENNSLFLPTAIYFWIVTATRALTGTLIFNTYLSMLPEQSQTLTNRHKVASLRAFFMIIASVISLFLLLFVQSLLPDPQNAKHYDPSGQIILNIIPVMGFILTCVGLIAVVVVFFSVDESFYLYNSNSKKEKVSLRGTFKKMAEPARDYKYRNLVYSGFFMNIGGSIFGFLLFPFQTFLLEFQQAEFLIYVIISLAGKLGWYFVWRFVIKKSPLVKSYSLALTFSAIVSFTDFLFLLSNLPYILKILLFVVSFGTILGTNYSIPLFGIPLGASLIHEAAVKKNSSDLDETISNISGSYYGFSTFISSLGAGFFQIIIGLILTGANQRDPMIITLLFGSQGFFYLIAIFFLRKITLDKPVEIDASSPQIEMV